jgi:cobalt/nickel transport system permease protein
VSVLDRALTHATSLDELARRPTPLGGIDARAKVAATAAFLVTTASFERHDLSRPLPLFVMLAAAVALGDVPVRVVLGRLALALPFAALVGAWNPWFEPEVALRVGGVAVTGGWLSFGSILLRVALGFSALVVLIATTGFDAVCSALGRLGVPRVLVTQLLLLYRYFFVIGAEAGRMLRAHSLRAPDRGRPTVGTARSLLGLLLLRALARAERVHAAMLCRGFTGELRRLDRTRWRGPDLGFFGGTLAALLAVRAWDLPRLLSELLT